MMTETVVNVQDAPNSNAANKQNDRPQSTALIKINIQYFQTLPGLIKIAQLICGIFCMSFASAVFAGATHFFIFVAVTSFIVTLLWSFFYLLTLREALSNLPINWIMTELLMTGIFTVMYAIACIVQLAVWANHYWPGRGLNITAGVFAIPATGLYAFGTFLLFIESKSS